MDNKFMTDYIYKKYNGIIQILVGRPLLRMHYYINQYYAFKKFGCMKHQKRIVYAYRYHQEKERAIAKNSYYCFPSIRSLLNVNKSYLLIYRRNYLAKITIQWDTIICLKASCMIFGYDKKKYQAKT